MGFLRQIARKTLRRSRPHGLRGKRNEPTVDEEMERMRSDAELDLAEIDAELAEEHDQWLADDDPEVCPNCGSYCYNDPCFSEQI